MDNSRYSWASEEMRVQLDCVQLVLSLSALVVASVAVTVRDGDRNGVGLVSDFADHWGVHGSVVLLADGLNSSAGGVGREEGRRD